MPVVVKSQTAVVVVDCVKTMDDGLLAVVVIKVEYSTDVGGTLIGDGKGIIKSKFVVLVALPEATLA